MICGCWGTSTTRASDWTEKSVYLERWKEMLECGIRSHISHLENQSCISCDKLKALLERRVFLDGICAPSNGLLMEHLWGTNIEWRTLSQPLHDEMVSVMVWDSRGRTRSIWLFLIRTIIRTGWERPLWGENGFASFHSVSNLNLPRVLAMAHGEVEMEFQSRHGIDITNRDAYWWSIQE